MFFEAMKRKGYSSDAKEMKTVVPIHNAVNERAWKEIREWERPWGSDERYVLPSYKSNTFWVEANSIDTQMRRTQTTLFPWALDLSIPKSALQLATRLHNAF